MKAFEILARNLRNCRLKKELSQQSLAELAGVSYKYYQKIETGRIPTVKLDTIEKFAHALDVSPWVLLHPEEVEPAKIKKARSPRIDR